MIFDAAGTLDLYPSQVAVPAGERRVGAADSLGRPHPGRAHRPGARSFAGGLEGTTPAAAERATGPAEPLRRVTEGGDDEVVPTLSRTGKGSSAIGRPSRASRTSRPIARPLSAPGCSTVVSTWSSHGRSTPSNPVTREVLRHPQAQRLRGAHHPGGEQVGLGHDRRRPAVRRHVEQQPGRRPPRPRR